MKQQREFIPNEVGDLNLLQIGAYKSLREQVEVSMLFDPGNYQLVQAYDRVKFRFLERNRRGSICIIIPSFTDEE